MSPIAVFAGNCENFLEFLWKYALGQNATWGKIIRKEYEYNQYIGIEAHALRSNYRQ